MLSVVMDDGEYRKLRCQLGKRRVIALAPLAVDHRRSEHDHLEVCIAKLPDLLVCLPLTVSIEVQRLRLGVLS